MLCILYALTSHFIITSLLFYLFPAIFISCALLYCFKFKLVYLVPVTFSYPKAKAANTPSVAFSLNLICLYEWSESLTDFTLLCTASANSKKKLFLLCDYYWSQVHENCSWVWGANIKREASATKGFLLTFTYLPNMYVSVSNSNVQTFPFQYTDLGDWMPKSKSKLLLIIMMMDAVIVMNVLVTKGAVILFFIYRIQIALNGRKGSLIFYL